MNVAFDTNTILSTPGGAATYFLELLHALLEQVEGDDRLFVFSANEDDAAPLPWLLRNDQLHGLSAPFGTGRLWRRLRFPAVESLVRAPEFRGRLNVCHSFHPPLMPSRAPARLLTLSGLPAGEDLGPLRRSLQRADTVITASRRLADETVRRLAAGSRIDPLSFSKRFRVIPPAVHERYRKAPKAATVEQLCQRFPLLEEPYLLAAGAAAEPERSVPLLADAYGRAWADDPSLPVLVFVAAREHVSAVSAALGGRSELDGRLLVMEEILTEELPALYAGSRFLLHPGLDLTFGSSVLEAASSGVPAVVGAGAGVLEVLGSSLVVPVDDTPEAWAAAILELHANAELRSTRVDEARVRARTNTWSAVAREHWDLYRAAS